MKTREQKRVEAQERQEYYRLRTPLEQLALVRERPGEAAKEKAKLKAKLNADAD